MEYFKNDQVKAFKVSNTNYLDLEIYDLGEDEFVYDPTKIINPTKDYYRRRALSFSPDPCIIQTIKLRNMILIRLNVAVGSAFCRMP